MVRHERANSVHSPLGYNLTEDAEGGCRIYWSSATALKERMSEDDSYTSSGWSSEDESEELDLGFEPAVVNGDFYPLTPQQPATGPKEVVANNENTIGTANTIPAGLSGPLPVDRNWISAGNGGGTVEACESQLGGLSSGVQAQGDGPADDPQFVPIVPSACVKEVGNPPSEGGQEGNLQSNQENVAEGIAGNQPTADAPDGDLVDDPGSFVAPQWDVGFQSSADQEQQGDPQGADGGTCNNDAVMVDGVDRTGEDCEEETDVVESNPEQSLGNPTTNCQDGPTTGELCGGELQEQAGEEVPERILIGASKRTSDSVDLNCDNDNSQMEGIEQVEGAQMPGQEGVHDEGTPMVQGEGADVQAPVEGTTASQSVAQSGFEEEDLLDFEEDDLLDADISAGTSAVSRDPRKPPDPKKPRLSYQAAVPQGEAAPAAVPPPSAEEEAPKSVGDSTLVKADGGQVNPVQQPNENPAKIVKAPSQSSSGPTEGGQKRKRELIPVPASKDLDGFSMDSFDENFVISVGDSGKGRQVKKEGKFDKEKWRKLVSSDGEQQQYCASSKEKECRERPNRKDERIVTYKTSKVDVFEMDTQLNLNIRIDGEDAESYVAQKNIIVADPRYIDDTDYAQGLDRAEGFLDHNGKQQLMSHSTSIRHSVISELGEMDMQLIPHVQKYVMGRLKECRKSSQGRTIRDECKEIKDDKFFDLGCRRLHTFVPTTVKERLLKCSVPKRRELLISFGLVPFPIIEPSPGDYFQKLLEEDSWPAGRQKPAVAKPGLPLQQPDVARPSRNSQPARDSVRKEKPGDGRSREPEKGGGARDRPGITDSRRTDSRRNRPSRDVKRDERPRDRRDMDEWKNRRDMHHSRKGPNQGRDRGRRRDSPPPRHQRRDHHSPASRPPHRHRSPMRRRDLSPHHHHHHQPPPPPRRRMDEIVPHGGRHDGIDRAGQRGGSGWVTAGMGPLAPRKQPSPQTIQAPLPVPAPFQMDLNPVVAGLSQQGGLVGTGLSLNDQQTILLAQQRQQQLLNAQNVQPANIGLVNQGNVMDVAGQHAGLPINTINHSGIAQHQGLQGQGQLLPGFNLMALPSAQHHQHRIRLKLSSGGCLCPDPARKDDPNPYMRLNEDAYYICENALAVADGLGGTLQHGVSSAEYARALAETAAKAMDKLIKESNGRPWTPKVAIEYAYTQIDPQGASTLCLLAFDANQSILHVGKVGDGGYVVLRPTGVEDMEIVSPWLPFKNPQEHPIGIKSTNYLTSMELRQRIGGFHPQHAIESQVLLQEGDIVIAATDGFFDVIYLHGEKGKPLRRQIRRVGLEPMMLAQQLTDLARQFAATRTTDCPICEEGRRANDERTASGVQPDDIAVVAAHVVRS